MNDNGGMFLSLLPFFILSAPFAVVNYFLAPRLGKSGGLWGVLFFDPIHKFCLCLVPIIFRGIFGIRSSCRAREAGRIWTIRKANCLKEHGFQIAVRKEKSLA